MAELLVRVVDKTNPNDAAADRLLPKAGDVIDVHPDGWAWSKAELSNPEWRILRIPDLDVGSLDDLMQPIMDATGALNRRRRKGFNLTAPDLARLIAEGQQVITLTGAARTAALNSRASRNPHGPIVIG